jgi:hypothetical protein
MKMIFLYSHVSAQMYKRKIVTSKTKQRINQSMEGNYFCKRIILESNPELCNIVGDPLDIKVEQTVDFTPTL